jgi:hypothetical protein
MGRYYSFIETNSLNLHSHLEIIYDYHPQLGN